MTIEEILNLTMKQFSDRIGDIFIIEEQFRASGKGRFKRVNLDKLKEQAIKKGIAPPKTEAFIKK